MGMPENVAIACCLTTLKVKCLVKLDGSSHDRSGLQRQLAIGTTGRVSNTVGYRHDIFDWL